MVLTLIGATVLTTHAQDDKSKRPSPPAKATNVVDGATVTIGYSQPAVKGRTIWGDLVPYGKVWRTGANEATWIEVSEDVTIGDSTLPKGKYSLFTIPGEDEWTIIFNKTWEQWGAYKYDADQDALRVTAKPEKTDAFSERFTIAVSPEGVVSMTWANLATSFDID